MKADGRGKEKIAEHTRKAAQEMHRISTGHESSLTTKNHASFRRVAVDPSRSSFAANEFAGRTREFIESQRIIPQ
jgi:hypothetical protein